MKALFQTAAPPKLGHAVAYAATLPAKMSISQCIRNIARSNYPRGDS